MLDDEFVRSPHAIVHVECDRYRRTRAAYRNEHASSRPDRAPVTVAQAAEGGR